MSALNVLSWNTRGMNSPTKRCLVFQFIKSYNPHICVLQETHLMGSRILSIKKPWVGYHYYSTHSNFARGVSVLLKSLPFQLLDLAPDTDGRYVIIHAKIYSLTWTIVGLYLPPPASLLLLNQITSKMAEFASDNNVIRGDFNLVPDSGIDWLMSVGHPCSGLAEWADPYGLTDVWRWRHPHARAYTCHSASH